ncbi:MAG: hypothetical protein VB068_12135 [Petrimonas sp.]|nr:hypothetical protein [Petrimonas sp.]
MESHARQGAYLRTVPLDRDRLSRIGMLQAVRIGDESANTSILRKMGFVDYLKKRSISNEIVKIPFAAMEPELQGFLAMKTLIEYLTYRGPVKLQNYVSLDILTKDTIDYYNRFHFIS